MRAFVGLEMSMGLCDKPAISDYFETYWLTGTPGYSTVMSRNRFQLIRSFFHMNDNTDKVPKGQPGHDPLFKVRPILDIVQGQYVKLYQAHKEVSIDEAMLAFKGRLGLKQYMQDKPTKWGVKLWSLCDNRNGFMLKWNVYTGAGEGTVGDVVRSLMIPEYVDHGYHLYCDNLYSSPDLFVDMRNRRTGACGTLRSNRVGNPVAILPASRGRRNDATARYPRITLKKGEDPVFFTKDNMLCLY
ncbi:piggyBac transposable element-derived protein 4-like [Lineus longissimus]|uniref:piggyBac transposable element-derived protein 4-like n=1 Tax=Lineus longissimus TaxID=88925 RepID=UPI00315DB074